MNVKRLHLRKLHRFLIQQTNLTLKEAKYIITIVMDLNVIPLALQITCLAGKRFLISSILSKI